MSKAFLDLEASLNLMSLSMVKMISDLTIRLTRMTLQLANRSIKISHRVVEDLLLRVGEFTFPIDFVLMEMEEDKKVPLILGISFMETTKIVIDVDKGKMKIGSQDEEEIFDIFETLKECIKIEANHVVRKKEMFQANK